MRPKYGFLIIFIAPILGFILSLLTIYDYGVNWDSLQHLVRGQIYYRYLTTGKTDFSDIPDICRDEIGNGSTKDYSSGRVCDRHHKPRTSFYQKVALDFSWTEKMTIGHPPFTDIVLALSNHIFYQKLGWLEDIQSYHVYGVFMTFIMACIVALWSYQTFGFFSSIIAVLTLYTYPLLFAEQHFNLKDPAVAAYFTGFMYFIWLGFHKKSYIALYVAGLFAGFSLGTKFNILFGVPVVGLWFLFVYFLNGPIKTFRVSFSRIHALFSFSMLYAVLTVPIITFSIFYFSYPALWDNPISKILSVIQYYKEVGGSRCYYVPLTGQWISACSDVHTIRLLITTLPFVTLFLLFYGFLYAWKRINKHTCVLLLWLLWFVITLVRATLPITALYGGSLRQIMEFIPAVSLLSGFGAAFFWNSLGKRFSGYVFILLLCYLPIIITMVRLHPNENLFYNTLAGGLKGAVDKKFPIAVNTYGNGYKKAIDWINKNAVSGSSVYIATGIASAVPSVYFRPDILYRGSLRYLEGFDHSYIIELTQPGMDIRFFHNMRFLKKFVNPIKEFSIDEVPYVTIWKLDDAYKRIEQNTKTIKPIFIRTFLGGWQIEFDHVYNMMNIQLVQGDDHCRYQLFNSYVLFSYDGVQYTRFSEQMAAEKNKILFAGDKVKNIIFIPLTTDECNMESLQFEGTVLSENITGESDVSLSK